MSDTLKRWLKLVDLCGTLFYGGCGYALPPQRRFLERKVAPRCRSHSKL